MGTNFYIRKKLSNEDMLKAESYLHSHKYNELRELLPNDIHIGKRSCGWKFLWDANNFEYFEPSKESLFDWLDSNQIIDEYGREFTFDQFINKELNGWLDKGYDLESYYKKYPEYLHEYFGRDTINIFKNNHPEVDVNYYGEFYIDDLRFTVHTDFG